MIWQRIWQIIVISAVATAAAWGLQRIVTASGGSRITIPWTIPIILVIIAGVVIGLATPIFRRMRGKRRARIEPTYALRVLALARAAIITGAVFVGAGAGTMVFLELLPSGQGQAETASAFVCACAGLIASVAGIIAEQFCRIPPEEHDEDSKGTPKVPALS